MMGRLWPSVHGKAVGIQCDCVVQQNQGVLVFLRRSCNYKIYVAACEETCTVHVLEEQDECRLDPSRGRFSGPT
jgi:hypothetical protein